MSPSERITVGYVARAHGLRGELRVHLHDPSSEVLFDCARVWLSGVPYQVVGARPTTAAVLLQVAGVDDRDAAEALRGSTVDVDRADVALAPGEFLLADLIGCGVVDEAGEPLGRVVEVMPGPQDRMVIHDDRFERMLPIVPQFVISVDIAGRRIVVSLPEDLPAEPLARS